MLGAICSSCNKWQAEGTNKKLEQSKQKKKSFKDVSAENKEPYVCLGQR